MAMFITTWWSWPPFPLIQTPDWWLARTCTEGGKVVFTRCTASLTTTLRSKGMNFSSWPRLKASTWRFSSRARITAW